MGRNPIHGLPQTPPETDRRLAEDIAPGSDVPPRPSLDADAAELGHGGDEGPFEGCGVLGPGVDSGAGTGVGMEDLIGGEEAQPLLEVLEVDIVEGPRGDGVHVDGDPGVDVARAHGLQLRRVGPVQRRVHRVP